MAKGLRVGDTVYIPRARLGLSVNDVSALHKTTVQAVVNRSIQVGIPGGGTATVASSAAHANIGVLILRIGDFDTEITLLDPLAKSLLQYCRLLAPDDTVLIREVRTRDELQHIWSHNHGAYSHVILVGHGREDAVRFGAQDWVTASEFAGLLTVEGMSPKVIVSLGCQTGNATFGQELSRHDVCQAMIGPLHTIHGAIASQFCQTFLVYHLLQGETTTVAFRHARTSIPGAATFRLWDDGELTAGG